MAITKNTSAPLVVVCGATGLQGGSVILALSESARPYRIRGITRDVSKAQALELAARGVEMVGVSIAVENEADVLKAFDGASIVFAMTTTEPNAAEIGIMLVDVAKAVEVDLLVWSGLPYTTKLSGGKATVHPWDAKAKVAEYARESGTPFADVQAGFFASNFETVFKPNKQEDGSYTLALPADPDIQLPVIDIKHDYGRFVRTVIESPALGAGAEVLTYGEMISTRECLAQLAEITHKKINYTHMSEEEFITIFPGSRSEALAAMAPMRWIEDFGYYGGKDIKPSSGYLNEKPRTWAEYCSTKDWDVILV